jgi:DNA topoisomerase-1
VGRLYASLKPTDDLFELSFERALELIKEKEAGGGKGKRSAEPLKTLGEHPDGGAVELFEGRYGPYVKHGKVNASLPKDTSVESLTLEEALELIAKRAAQPKKTKRSTRKKS